MKVIWEETLSCYYKEKKMFFYVLVLYLYEMMDVH